PISAGSRATSAQGRCSTSIFRDSVLTLPVTLHSSAQRATLRSHRFFAPPPLPHRSLLPPAADHDPRAASLHRPGQIARMIDPVVLAGEAHVVAGEHGEADLGSFLEHC